MRRLTYEDDIDDALAAALRNTVRNVVKEKRFSDDGVAYTYAEFVGYFGDDDGWARWVQDSPQDGWARCVQGSPQDLLEKC